MEQTFLKTMILARHLSRLVLALLSFGLAMTISAQEKDVFPVPDSYKVEGIPVIKNSEVKDLFYVKVDYDTKTSKLCQTNMQAEKCFPIDLKGIWAAVDADENKVLVRYSKDSSSQLLYVYDRQDGKLRPVDDNANSQKAFLFG